ncbi:transcriptional regulator [Candidatus Roizmanbacteria bacterium CG22_combo_CG10-13_8_21_14_all_35_9]|uniref:Transcriptional regulator n=2 Tax=Candidatus Roizmaniibacteriota TaxID=1752723 RepID=A0A2H0C0R6_9BACT|nr:MAG: transcriptional regulator [Candidatus Roizmanbacteria bacterium CG22_combo_CG10-13_8_21_14_all_35_9]PIY71416.1 MAG: transcriptional regulator [Candidatus Roizmanbacteria bacterium CG_4_10_14_0_8_um_filter_35_28]
MRNKVVLLNINRLKPHEMVDKKRLSFLLERIKKDKYLKNPVVVEDKHLIILDGHHRVKALKHLRAKKIPAFLVNYKNDDIRVFLRKKLLLTKLIKNIVIENSLNSKLFPSKTTRHLIRNRPRNINVKINQLL